MQGADPPEGADILGWSVKQVGTDGSPEKVQGAFESAIRDGADAVIINAADKDALAKPLEDAKKAGVEFVTCCSLGRAGNGRLFNIGPPEQNAPIGESSRPRSSPTAAARRTPSTSTSRPSQILAAVARPFTSEDEGALPGLQDDTIDIPLTSLGKDAPDRIVSYLRSHPKVNYVVLSESGALGPGLTAALQAAGLADKVKIVGQGGNEAVYQEVEAGDWLAVVPSALYSYDYAMLDALARKFAGVPVRRLRPSSG